MVGVGDLVWRRGTTGSYFAGVPGTAWILNRRSDGTIYALRVTPFDYVDLKDLIDLQCWLCIVTEGGNR